MKFSIKDFFVKCDQMWSFSKDLFGKCDHIQSNIWNFQQIWSLFAGFLLMLQLFSRHWINAYYINYHNFNDTRREKLCFTQFSTKNGCLAASDLFCMFTQSNKGTLMQIWKSANIFVFIWKQNVEGFTLKRLLLFEICEREICKKFVYKHSETIEYVKN